MFFLFFSIFLSCSTFSQEKLPQIDVLADSTEPLTINQSPHQDETSDYLWQLPNVHFTGGANRFRFVQIRGLGETSQFERSQTNAVGFFYEHIDLSEESSLYSSLPQQNIYFYPGPHPFDWGSKAFAGYFSAHSPLSLTNTYNNTRISVEQYNHYSLNSQHTISVNNQHRYFVHGAYSRSDGFYKNVYFNNETNNREESALVIAGDNTSNYISIRHHHILMAHNNGYDVWSFTPSYQTLSDYPGRDEHRTLGHSLEMNVDLTNAQKLKIVTSLTNTRQLESYDVDWGNNQLWLSTPDWNDVYNYFSAFQRRRFKLHQKIIWQLNSSTNFGIHYSAFNEEQIIQFYKNNLLRSQAESRWNTQSYAFFASKRWRGDHWKALLSLRLERQFQFLKGVSFLPLEDEHNLWAFESNYIFSWNRFYSWIFNLHKGYRGGGYNISPQLSLTQRPYFPEDIYMFEFISDWHNYYVTNKSKLFLQYNDHQQIRSSFQLDSSDPNTYTYFTSNYGSNISYGIESATSIAYEPLRFIAQLGLLNSQFLDYSYQGKDLNGRSLPNAPAFSYFLRTEYAADKHLFFLEYYGRDAYFFSTQHDFKAPSTGLINIGWTYTKDQWQVNLWIKNLTNEKYPVRSFYFANEPPNWEDKLYIQLGAPRIIGSQVVFRY